MTVKSGYQLPPRCGLRSFKALAKPPGAAASGGYKRQHFANPALDLNKSKISCVRNSGYQAAPDEMFLVPAVLQKHILSDSFVVPAKRRWPQNISCPHRFIRET
ncbi:hypothetical protein JQZ71_004317 [Escherichia coli]|nr:hypothetical protein [Escherichia coli]